MAVLRIVKHGEAPLKKISAPVDFEAVRKDLPKLLRSMWAAMESVKGVGLAAPQIGLNIRLAVIDVKPEGKSQRLVLINPEILSKEGLLQEEEGCLSLPGVYAKINRFARVRIRSTDAEGKIYEKTGEGLLARAFQHEIDHLNGKLFIDHLDFANRLKVLSIVKEVRKNWN
jgi:peptide deformylase